MKFILKYLSWREMDSSHRLMILIVATLGLFNFFFGEIVPVNNGFGWDGVNYANMTSSLESMVSEGKLSFYYAQRILPSAIVRGLLLLVGASFSAINIIQGFEIYNLVLLLASCRIWKRLADNVSISLAGRWLGFSGLFFSYMGSKQVFFYPVLTDVTAFFVGMLLLIFYVEKRPIALFATTIVGALAWQVVGISGSMLIFFLRYDLPLEAIEPPSNRLLINTDKHGSKIACWLAILLIMSIAGFAVLAVVNDYLNNFGMILTWKDMRVFRLLTKLEFFLTGLPSLAGVVIALAILIGSGLFFRSLYTSFWKKSFSTALLAISALLIPRIIVGVISNPAVPNVSGLMTVLAVTLFPPPGKFLLPIITLVAYWGPLVILLVLKWKDFCIESRRLGPGFVAVVALSLPLGLSAEPRFITCAWPFFVVGVVLALEKASKRPSFFYVITILTIFYSQFWLPINSVAWTLDYHGGYNLLYFIHHGMFLIMDTVPYFFYVIFHCGSFFWLRNTMRAEKPAYR